MKLVYTSDNYFFQTNDGRFWSSTSFPIDFILKNLPEVSDWTFWGRIKKVDDSSSLYFLPDKVNNCSVSYAGPVVRQRSRLLWLLWIVESFLSFKRELASADIVFLKMPYIFSCIAYHLLRKKHIVISHQVGNPRETVAIMLPRLKWFGNLIAKYCTKIASRADKAFFISNALRNIYGDVQRGDIVCNESRVTKDMIVSDYSSNTHKPPRVVYVGRLSIEKGLLVLLEAIAKVTKKIRVELWIIGAGSLRNEMEDLADKLGISENLKWFGWLRWGPQLFEKIGQADTLVLPSFSEGLGLVLVEAMSQGLVVVASSVGGIPEILEDGQAGILIPPGNVRELSKAIMLSVTDIARRDYFIKKGLLQAQKNSLEKQTGKLVKEISKLICRKKNL